MREHLLQLLLFGALRKSLALLERTPPLPFLVALARKGHVHLVLHSALNLQGRIRDDARSKIAVGNRSSSAAAHHRSSLRVSRSNP